MCMHATISCETPLMFCRTLVGKHSSRWCFICIVTVNTRCR